MNWDIFRQMEKSNIIPIHRKSERQLIKNERQVSLLTICGKLFERIIFNYLSKHFKENNLFSPHQSGFIPGDSRVQQLIIIPHEVYKAFDCSPLPKVLSVFLDISKPIDMVWYHGLLYKLKRNGRNGDLLKLIASFSSDRYQGVELNGKTS